MGGPTGSYATTGIALRVIGVLKPPHHDKVETPQGGELNIYKVVILSAKILFVTYATTALCMWAVCWSSCISTIDVQQEVVAVNCWLNYFNYHT
jgi:hypothetical protein